MSERLIIRLASQADSPVMWLVYNDSQQEVIASGELASSGELAQLTAYATNKEVDVLVPGDDVNYFEVTLPKANRRQAIKAIPYMLEDELASSVELLHFVYAKPHNDQQGVYVCQQDKIQWWLAILKQADIVPRSMTPDYLALPTPESGGVSLLQLGDSIAMRSGEAQGQTIDKAWLDLEFIAQQEQQPPIVYHYGIEPELMLDTVEWREQSLLMPMQQLALGCEKVTTNMLIGMFEQNKNDNNHWLIWRTAACVAMVSLLVFFADTYIETQQLDKQRVALKQQSDAIYQRLNPGVKRVRMVKKQMTTELTQLGGGNNTSEMLTMLVALDQAFKQVPALKPVTVKFDDKRRELRLQADATDYQQFDKFKQILSKDYTVTLGAINNNGSKTNGSLTIKATS